LAQLTIRSVSKLFGDKAAVDGVSLDAPSGEFLALLGPSGCGKTTLLRLIAGFERHDGGSIDIHGRPVAGEDGLFVPPEKRNVGMVFQSYALWPHMNVAENVGYPLRVRGERGKEAAAKVEAALQQVGLDGLGARRPSELSGGQRQRVALARCLAMQPDIVLLDEPLANLDAHLKESMQQQFRDFHESTGATMVYVTHDQAEAMALADRVAVMDDGKLVQIAAPSELYACPASSMVARFIGRGQVLDAETLDESGDRMRVSLCGVEATVRGKAAARKPVTLCLRPEWMELAEPGSAAAISGKIVKRIYRGAVTSLEIAPDAGGPNLHVEAPGDQGRVGDSTAVRIRDGWIIPED
jgi:iron(III) transport system ATP-binding protein